MEKMRSISVSDGETEREISLYHGDLMDLSAADPVDLLVTPLEVGAGAALGRRERGGGERRHEEEQGEEGGEGRSERAHVVLRRAFDARAASVFATKRETNRGTRTAHSQGGCHA